MKSNFLFFKVIVQRFRNGFNAKAYVPPTFSEFVQFVVNEDLNDRTMDMHWEPAYKFCTPCQFQFTDIVKMETFDRDQDQILQKAGIKDLVGLRKDNVGKGGETSEEMTTKYLKELPPKLFKQLVSIYQIDFDIFGYKVPKLDLISPYTTN
jgi:Sulfotransferase family